MSKSTKLTGLAVGVALSSFLAVGAAEAVTFSGTNGSNLSASVTFDNVAGNLQVTLTNTSASDTLKPIDILTAVFWSGTSGLTPLSALLGAGSSVYQAGVVQAVGTNLGGEWDYASGALPGAPGGNTQGIGSAGFGIFGNASFNGPNLQGPVSVNGMQYGILSAGDNVNTNNPGQMSSSAFVKNSVVFTLTGTFNLASITNVWFQYGTGLNEPSFAGPKDPGGVTPDVPIPAALPLLAAGLGVLGLAGRRKRQAKA